MVRTGLSGKLTSITREGLAIQGRSVRLDALIEQLTTTSTEEIRVDVAALGVPRENKLGIRTATGVLHHCERLRTRLLGGE